MQKTAIISLNSINLSMFVMGAHCVVLQVEGLLRLSAGFEVLREKECSDV